jgi:hypothetical protein
MKKWIGWWKRAKGGLNNWTGVGRDEMMTDPVSLYYPEGFDSGKSQRCKSVQNQIYWYQFKYMQLLLVKQKDDSIGAGQRGNAPWQCGGPQCDTPWRRGRGVADTGGRATWRRGGQSGVAPRGNVGTKAESRSVALWLLQRGHTSGSCNIVMCWLSWGRAPSRRGGYGGAAMAW